MMQGLAFCLNKKNAKNFSKLIPIAYEQSLQLCGAKDFSIEFSIVSIRLLPRLYEYICCVLCNLYIALMYSFNDRNATHLKILGNVAQWN